MGFDWQKEIFGERSFSDLYRRASIVSSSKLNRNCAISAANFFAAVIALSVYFKLDLISVESVKASLDHLNESGIGFSVSILGFLVAGFSIFSTITKPELFIALAKIRYRKNINFNNFQFIFYNFMYVFYNYVTFLLVCFIFDFLFGGKSPFVGIQDIISEFSNEIFIILYGGIFCLIFGWLVYLVMLLRSFIWNMYQAVILIIATTSLMK